MATPKVQRHVRPQRLRIPSNEEMERVRLLWEYGQAQTKAKKHGLIEAMLPPEFRIRRPAPKSEQENQEKVMRRMDEILEERVRARMKALNIPYTDERPYRRWYPRKPPPAKAPAPSPTTTREREVIDTST